MAETEDCKVPDIATMEEKHESGMSFYQDPSISDFSGSSHNIQANDLKNSYVEANGINDFDVSDKNVVADSSSVLPKSVTMVDDQGIELNSPNEKLVVVTPLMFGQIPIWISDKIMEHVSSLEDGNKFQIPLANYLVADDCNYDDDDDESRIVLEAEDGNNDDESKIVLEKKDVNNDDESKILLETKDVNNDDESKIVLETEDVYNDNGSKTVLDTEVVNNDDESRIVLETEDVEDMEDQFDTSSQCHTENSFETENERNRYDDVVLNKIVGAESSIISPELITTVDDQGLELNSKNEKLHVVDDEVAFNKNEVADSSSVSPESVITVDDLGLELNSENEKLDVVDGEVSNHLNREGNGSVMGLDSLEEFPALMSRNRREIISDVSITSATKISCSFDVNNDVELKTENGQTGNYESKDISVASSSTCSIETVRKPFNFLIKFPRADDEVLGEQIRLAKLQLDEKMKLRDAIQVQIQEKRQANNQIHRLNQETAKDELRSAWTLVKSKHMEIDSHLSVINKAKTALSIKNINSQIRNMDYQMQHGTITLKEEKQLTHEIKQLKQMREELSSNMGSQDEINQAIERREEAEDCLKILRKDLDILKNGVYKAETTVAEAKKKYDDENQKVRELQVQFRAADKVQQKAYAQWQNLKKERLKKSKHFFKYKDDAAVATNHALNRDTEVLHRLCTNQVEFFMQQWNTNKDYRGEYAKCNARSTVRRFGTLDGRALGHGEKPPLLPDERVNRMVSGPVKVDLASSQIPGTEVKQETTNENATLDGKPANKVAESENITKGTINEVHEDPIKSKDEVESVMEKDTPDENMTLGGKKVKKCPASTARGNGSDIVSVGDLTNEGPIESKDDQVESLMNEKREEEEAKLKEQWRLEEMAKANEALERKKRQAEKQQVREQLKMQKEAEEREKKREKRRRKKERKMAALKDTNNSNSCENAPICESSEDIEVKEMPSVEPKKPQKPWLFAKYSKKMSVPPALRNRNKKRSQQWMWVCITSFIILVVLLLGNIGEYSNLVLKGGSLLTNLLCMIAF